MTTQTPTPTLTAVDLFDQMADWEGAPPVRLRTLPLMDLSADVMDFLDATLPLTDGSVWVSVDLRDLARIASSMARAFYEETGYMP